MLTAKLKLIKSVLQLGKIDLGFVLDISMEKAQPRNGITAQPVIVHMNPS